MQEKEQNQILSKQKTKRLTRQERKSTIKGVHRESTSFASQVNHRLQKKQFSLALESEEDRDNYSSSQQTLNEEIEPRQFLKVFSLDKDNDPQSQQQVQQKSQKSLEEEDIQLNEVKDTQSFQNSIKGFYIVSQNQSQRESLDSDSNDKVQQEIRIKDPKNKRKKIVLLSIFIFVVFFIVGLSLLIYFLTRKKELTLEEKMAKGQEENVVQMKYYPGQRYQYKYSSQAIENKESVTKRQRRQLQSDFNNEDMPEMEQNRVFEEYNLEFICKDVSEEYINFFLVINNSTRTFQNSFCEEEQNDENDNPCEIFTDGFPNILTSAQETPKKRNLVKIKKDQKVTKKYAQSLNRERRVLPSVDEDIGDADFSFGQQAMEAKEPSQNYNQTMELAQQEEQEEIQGGQQMEQLVGFYDDEEELREFLNLSLYEYIAVKQITIVEFFIKKTGGISEVIIPYPMNGEIHVMIPKILDTFAPILKKQVYSGEEQLQPIKSAVGDYEPEYQLEVDGENLQMKNSYTKEQGNENGQMGIKQKAESNNKFNKDGQMDTASQSSSMNLSPPGQDDPEESGPTNQMMGDIEYDTQFTMKLLFNNTVENTYLNLVEENFEKCPQLRMTYDELNQMIIDYELEQMDQLDDDIERGGEQEEDLDIVDDNGRRILVRKGKATMGKQKIEIFSQNLMGKTVTAHVTIQCFEASDKGKDICDMGLEVMNTPTGLKQQFRANMSRIFKTINWFRIRVIEGISNLVRDVRTDLLELTDAFNDVIDNLDTIINPETNAITQPIFLINDFIETMTTKLFIGFSEFLSEQIQILKNLIQQPTFNLIQLLKGKTELIFQDIDDINDLIINSYHRQTKAMLYFLETQPNIYEDDQQVLEKMKSEFERFIKIYSESPMDKLNDIYTEQAVEPVQQLVNTITVSLEGGFDMTDIKSKIIGGVFQTLIYTHVNGVVIKEAEKQQADLRKNVEFVKQGFQVRKDEIYALFDDLQERFNERKISAPSDGQLKKNFAVFLRTEPLYSQNLFDIQSSSMIDIDDLIIPDDVAQSREFLLSEVQRGIDLFYSYTEDIFYSFKNGVSEIISSLVDIKKNVKEQFDDTKESMKTLYSESKEFLKNTTDGFKNLLKGSNSTNYITEDQTISLTGIADDINGVIQDINTGVAAVEESIEKAKGLIETVKKVPKQFEELIEGPFKSFNDGELEGTDHQLLQQMFSSLLSGSLGDAFNAVTEQVTQGIGKDVVEKFTEENEEMNKGFKNYVADKVIGNLSNVNQMFEDIFFAILNSFSINIGPETIGEPFVKEKKFTKLFITPVGIPISVEAFAAIRLELYYGVIIQFKKVQIYGGAQANCEVGARAGVDALVAKAGIEVKGVIFDGKVQVDLALSITNKLEGFVRGTVVILPIYFQFGIYYQIIGVHPSCMKLNRRILDVKEIQQQLQLSQTQNQPLKIGSQKNFLRKKPIIQEEEYQNDDLTELERRMVDLAKKIHHRRRKLIWGAIKKIGKAIVSAVSKVAEKLYKVAKNGIKIIADNFCLPYLSVEFGERKYIYTKRWDIWDGVPPKTLFQVDF